VVLYEHSSAPPSLSQSNELIGIQHHVLSSGECCAVGQCESPGCIFLNLNLLLSLPMGNRLCQAKGHALELSAK